MLGCGALTHFLPHFPTSPPSSHFPHRSLHLPHTPTHFPTPPLIPLSTSSLLPPTLQYIFLLSPHLPHLLKVWRSYHVIKFLWRSYCGEVTMRRSYWQPFCHSHSVPELSMNWSRNLYRQEYIDFLGIGAGMKLFVAYRNRNRNSC